MTPTPDIEPIREGLARALFDATPFRSEAGPFEAQTEIYQRMCLMLSDACLTYLIKRQAFLYDVYERIIAEKGVGK